MQPSTDEGDATQEGVLSTSGFTLEFDTVCVQAGRDSVVKEIDTL